jgi:hypothetical protein
MVSTQARAALLSKRKRTVAKSHASVTGPFPLCHVLKSAVGCSPGSVAASPTAGRQIVVQRSLFCATRKARIVAKKSPRREKNALPSARHLENRFRRGCENVQKMRTQPDRRTYTVDYAQDHVPPCLLLTSQNVATSSRTESHRRGAYVCRYTQSAKNALATHGVHLQEKCKSPRDKLLQG